MYGFRVQDLGFRVWGLGFVVSFGLWVQGYCQGFRVGVHRGLGFRNYGKQGF